MSGGRANVGVGILSETCHRHGLSVPKAFAAAIERLKIRHPNCANVTLASRPIGGVVKMYGGIGPNHFDGGLLIGDAGSFVDPMTGEGITQGMESAVIASETVLDCLELGRFDAKALSRFEQEFRAYFDPPLLYLAFCASILRNWHFREFWLRASARGFERAKTDPEFARLAGCSFGGLNLRPQAIAGQIWSSLGTYLAEEGAKAIGELLSGRRAHASGLIEDFAAWERGWSGSVKEDPDWHAAWLADVARSAVRLQPTFWKRQNPRVLGPRIGV